MCVFDLWDVACKLSFDPTTATNVGNNRTSRGRLHAAQCQQRACAVLFGFNSEAGMRQTMVAARAVPPLKCYNRPGTGELFQHFLTFFFFLQSSPFWQMDSVHPLVCFPVGTLLLFQFWTETLGMSGTDQSEGRGGGRAQTCYEGRLESCSARRARLLHAFLRLSDLKVTSGGQFRACAHTHWFVPLVPALTSLHCEFEQEIKDTLDAYKVRQRSSSPGSLGGEKKRFSRTWLESRVSMVTNNDDLLTAVSMATGRDASPPRGVVARTASLGLQLRPWLMRVFPDSIYKVLLKGIWFLLLLLSRWIVVSTLLRYRNILLDMKPASVPMPKTFLKISNWPTNAWFGGFWDWSTWRLFYTGGYFMLNVYLLFDHHLFSYF